MADGDEEVTAEDGLCAELPKKYKSIRDDLKSIFQFERSFIKDEEGPAWGDGPDATQKKCSIKRQRYQRANSSLENTSRV